MFRFSFDIDYNGTPSNPDDDTDVPDSLGGPQAVHWQLRLLRAGLLRRPGHLYRRPVADWPSVRMDRPGRQGDVLPG